MQLESKTFDGVAFKDDRVANEVLSAWTQQRPECLKHVTTISMANAGENLVPIETAKLEIDGKIIGITLIRLIQWMDTGQIPAVHSRLPPRLVLPSPEYRRK